MKSFLFSIFFLIACIAATAQQLHFVYLQTDSRKPFYAMLNGRNYSSSSIGYVILPKLQNGDYTIRVGFPRSEQPEQEFVVQVKNNDQGFLVKDFGDKGWGLFNLQSLEVQYAGAAAEKRSQLAAQQKAAEEKQQQEAAALAAQHRTDSLQAVAQAAQKAAADAEAALRQQRYTDSVQLATTASQLATAPAANQQKIDSLPKATEATNATHQKAAEEAEQRRITDSLQREAEAAMARQQDAAQQRRLDSLSKIQVALQENERLERLADSTAKAQAASIEKAKQNATGSLQISSPVLLQKTFTDSGWRYSYSVNGGTGKEAVDVFIPVRQPQTAIVATPAAKAPEVQNAVVSSPTIVAEPKKEDTRFLDMEFGSNTVVKTDTANPGMKVLHNSNCRAAADEKDFLTARKKMVAAESTEKMVAIARKLMKEKCFTTDQVRNLSFLFLTDADRYQFLDAAYPFALDAWRFSALQDLLKEDYYVQRFKAMLR